MGRQGFAPGPLIRAPAAALHAVELGGIQIDRGWGSSRCRFSGAFAQEAAFKLAPVFSAGVFVERRTPPRLVASEPVHRGAPAGLILGNAAMMTTSRRTLMASFVLVPGAGGMAWYWHRVVPLLGSAGHQAIAVDLPGDDRDAVRVRGALYRERHRHLRPS